MTSELQRVLGKILKTQFIDMVHFSADGTSTRYCIEEMCPDGMLISRDRFISASKVDGTMTINEKCIKVSGANGDYWFYPAVSQNLVRLITE